MRALLLELSKLPLIVPPIRTRIGSRSLEPPVYLIALSMITLPAHNALTVPMVFCADVPKVAVAKLVRSIEVMVLLSGSAVEVIAPQVVAVAYGDEV